MLDGDPDGGLGRQRRGGRARRCLDARHERAARQQDAPVPRHVDRDARVGHFDAALVLLEVDVGDAALLAGVRVGNHGLAERGAFDAELAGVLLEVFTRRLGLGALAQGE